MAAKTVINTNMAQTCGISIVIDQDQAKQLQHQQQKSPIDKITIYQNITNKLSTTTPTTATKTPIVATTTDRTRTVATATSKATPTATKEDVLKQGQQVAGVDFSAAPVPALAPIPTAVKTLIDVNRNNHEQHNNVVSNEYEYDRDNDLSDHYRRNNHDELRNDVGRRCGEFRIVSKETSYTATATFPHMLLKLDPSALALAPTPTSTYAPLTTSSSERGKPGAHTQTEHHETSTKARNGNSHGDMAGKSLAQRRNEDDGQTENGHNNDVTALSTASGQSEKRTTIIECNIAHDNAAATVNGNERNKRFNNNNVEVDVHVHVGADDVANVSDYDESRVTGVARIGQNAFGSVCANGVCDGDVCGYSDSVVDGVCTGTDDQRQLESEDAANDSLSLTSKADCASALTEAVASHKCAEQNANNSSPNAAQTSSHVVKIQIKQPLNTSEEVHESEKQTVTVVTLNEDTQKYPTETETKTKTVTETEIKIEPSKVRLVKGESIPSNTDNSYNNNNYKTNLHLNIESRMVQKPIMSTTTTTTTATGNIGATGTGSGSVVSTGNISSGGTTVTELNVTHPSYLYYVMSSGQFSPCDTLDSGTGSDLESSGNLTVTASPKMISSTDKLKMSNGVGGVVGVDLPKLEMHLKTTKIRLNGNKKSPDTQHHHRQQQHISSNSEHARAGSLTDSEESESSSLSCDSLHSTEFIRQSSVSPTAQNTSNNARVKMLGAFLPDSLLRDIRDRKFPTNDFETKYGNGNDNDDVVVVAVADADADDEGAASPSPTEREDAVNEADYASVEHVKFFQERNQNNIVVNKRVSLPNKTFLLNTEDGTFVDTKMNSMPRKYEADKYYQFHVKEHENFRSFGNDNGLLSDLKSLGEYEALKGTHDDAFAGYKDIRCGSATSTIRSSKGTVRGVKNRVRNGIATFLQLQHPNIKNFKEKDAGKVVLYTTSMGIIRDTYAKCANMKQILRTLLIKFEERDVFMSIEYQQEIKQRMHLETIKVPQLFVEGQHIGDADTVERLNESGELRQLLKPYKSIATTFTCQTCGGYRLLPCPSCNGSKKSVHRNHFTAEFVALKCMNCDEVGLVKCHNC